MAVACALTIPLGLWLGHIGKGGFLAINASNVGRAVPSLALIAFFVAYIGVGFTNLMLALVLLAIPPILTNTYTGVRQVDRDTVDAARGMGMTGAEIVRRVELPLALPLIFGGIRISAVNVVATATIAPLAGIITLGDPIINPNTYGSDGQLAAAIVVALLAVITEVSLGAVQRAVTPTRPEARSRPHRAGSRFRPREGSDHMRTLRWPLLLMLLLASLGIAACGDDDEDEGGGGGESTTQGGGQQAIQKNDSKSGIKVTIGSKNFTEQKVLGEIYAQALAAGGYDVSKELNLGDEKTALKAVESGEIDAYPEYTGTALLSFFGVQADKLPKDEQKAYDQAKAGFAEKNLTALPPTPFTSSNEVAVTKETADELGLKTISDLEGKSQDLTLYGSPECRQRLDCLLGLQEVYGLEFAKFVPVDLALRHEVLDEGPGRRVDRLHHRCAERARRLRPARGRQGHVPALQLDARGP